MLMILGLLAVLLVPLPSLTKGKKVKDLCFLREGTIYEHSDIRREDSNYSVNRILVNPFPTQIWILKETNKNSNNDTYGTRKKVMHMSTWMLLINEVLIRPNLVIGRSHYSIQSWVNPIIYLTGGCHSRFGFFLFFIRDKFAQSIGKCLLFKSDSTRRVVLQ